MKFLGMEVRFGREREETRAAADNPTVPVSSTSDLLALFGIVSGADKNLPAVTVETALTVPAFGGAVNFLSRSLANLPLKVLKPKGKGGAERVNGAIQRIMNEAPNPEWTSFGMRQYFWQQVFTVGRGLIWIEMQGATPVALWPIDATSTTVVRKGGRKFYRYNGKDYPAAEVIDVPFMLKADQMSVRSPVSLGSKAIALALAMTTYASGFFAGGGIPPLALSGQMPVGADAVARAKADVARAIQAATERGDPILPIPAGYELKPVGIEPEKGQLTEARVHQLQEIARIFNLPPVFIQDLSTGSFSNTEQQDLHLVKHLITQWAKALEEEINLKVFGPSRNKHYVEHLMDALLRGDLKSRIEALGKGVQTAQITPNEARGLDNREPMENGDVLYIQGATVPLGTQPIIQPPKPAADGDTEQ